MGYAGVGLVMLSEWERGEKRVFGGFNWAVRKNNEPPWLRSKMGRVRVKS
jgi:hypothetical protein